MPVRFEKRGGQRSGSGRPKTKPETIVKRIPVDRLEDVNALLQNKRPAQPIVTNGHRIAETTNDNSLPLYLSKVAAGIPSPADDHYDKQLDLNSYAIHDRSATIVVPAEGDSMNKLGIGDNTLLIVCGCNNCMQFKTGDIVLAYVNSGFTVKRLKVRNDRFHLIPESTNSAHKAITISGSDDRLIGKVLAIHTQLDY